MAKLAGYRKVLLCSALMAGAVMTTQAQAQVLANFDNNVVVDLSALDGGAPANSGPSIANPYVQAKMPPQQMPQSRFYGVPQGVQPMLSVQPIVAQTSEEPQSRLLVQAPQMGEKPVLSKPVQTASTIKLKKPAAPEKPQVGTVEVAQAAPKPMVKITPKPVVEVKTETADTAKLPSKVVAETPKPVVKEEKPVETAKVEQPKPVVAPVQVAEAPKEVAKPEPAPEKVMAEAPPPPPVSAVEPKEVESAMATKVEEKATSTASLPGKSESSVRVIFQSGQSKLPSAVEQELKKLADDLRAHPDDRVQLQAYAGGEELSASKARRLSLSRALAVRSYLIAQDVPSTRIDVRALGNKTTEEPFDRVDVQITPR